MFKSETLIRHRIYANMYLGMAYLFTGRCEDAIATCRKAVQAGPSNLLARVFLTAAYGSCGHAGEGRTTAAEVQAIGPNFSVENFEKQLPFKEEDKRLVIEGLRKAGLK